MRRRFAAFALPPALLLLALPACSPEVPATPTYTNDVAPILTAHCVRCHGAGGTLNAMPDVPSPSKMPLICYLQQYDDGGDCSVASTCQRGAGFCGTGTVAGTSMLVSYINNGPPLRMPPPPSDPLSHWEKEILTRWSGPNPAR